MRDWHELTSLMTERYDDKDRISYTQALWIIVGQGGLLFLDYCFRFMDVNLLLTLCIFIPMFMLINEKPAHAVCHRRSDTALTN